MCIYGLVLLLSGCQVEVVWEWCRGGVGMVWEWCEGWCGGGVGVV